MDYIVSVESDVFVPSFSGNMACAVEGDRQFFGHTRSSVQIGMEEQLVKHLSCKFTQRIFNH
jgi:hypothetical protein